MVKKHNQRSICLWLVTVNLLFIFYTSTANTIVEAGKDKKSPDDFAEALDTVLGDFAFPDVFLFDVWGAIADIKNGRM